MKRRMSLILNFTSWTHVIYIFKIYDIVFVLKLSGWWHRRSYEVIVSHFLWWQICTSKVLCIIEELRNFVNFPKLIHAVVKYVRLCCPLESINRVVKHFKICKIMFPLTSMDMVVKYEKILRSPPLRVRG